MKYFILFSFFLAPVLIFAQSAGNIVLPSAGIGPESPFYFLDKIGEVVRDFLTFNPDARAHLQISFASERIAEIKVLLETKGARSPGLDIARQRMKIQLAKANLLVADQKSKGRKIGFLAKELDDNLNLSKSSLEETFKNQKSALEDQIDGIKNLLKAARRSGDSIQESSLIETLNKIKIEKEFLESRKGEFGEDLENEKEHFEEEMEDKIKSEKALARAEEKKAEIIAEAREKGVDLPANIFNDFDVLISKAKEAFDSGKFVESRELAKQAKKTLKIADQLAEDLDKNQELKEDAEEEIKNAEEEKQEIINEAERENRKLAPGVFVKFDQLFNQAKDLFVKGNYQGAKQLAEQAKKALDRLKETEEKEQEKEIELKKEEQSENKIRIKENKR